ncbi:MAG: histone deacetylase [Candidatus Aminicenantes bacterium]|jgi:acetoin utilization deacetylase AcuC-like enzyme
MGKIRRIFKAVRRRRSPLKFVYCDAYWMVDIGNHVFPLVKYRRIYEKLLSMGIRRENFLEPPIAQNDDILRVHSPKYLKKLETGRLSHAEMAALELPYSPDLLQFAKLHVGGTVIAAENAMEKGITAHLGGGFHHAFSDHGEGFCVLNDVAVAIEKLKQTGVIQKALVVDCDVHQGNGTAEIFSNKDYVFTFSIHQMDIYPAHKPESSLDVGLWTGDGDEEYLGALRPHFPHLFEEFQPDVVFYLAGADPYEKDQLGGLQLTLEGLRERDAVVIGSARRMKIPLVILLAGGYAIDIEDTVAIHLNTIQVAQDLRWKQL